jgi:hypothetical protein
MSRNYSLFRGIISVSVIGYLLSNQPAQIFKKFKLFNCSLMKTIRFLFEGMSNRTFLLPVCYVTRLVLTTQLSSRSHMCNSMKFIETQTHIVQLTIEKLNKHEKSSYFSEKWLHCFCCSHFKPFSGNISFLSNYSA